MWQCHGDPKAQAETAIGRASTNIGAFEKLIFVEICLCLYVLLCFMDGLYIYVY